MNPSRTPRTASPRPARPLARVGLPVTLSVTLGTVALPAAADLALDPDRSRVSLVSVKVLADGSSSASERFGFSALSGSVAGDGQANVTIPLGSIDTGIDIRDERMGEHLFETSEYPDATISANVPEEALSDGTHTIDLPASLTLHGQTRELVLPVVIADTGDTVTVTTREPVLLDAAEYDLVGGLGTLADLAKLAHIPTTVPISFSLTFTDADS